MNGLEVQKESVVYNSLALKIGL